MSNENIVLQVFNNYDQLKYVLLKCCVWLKWKKNDNDKRISNNVYELESK